MHLGVVAVPRHPGVSRYQVAGLLHNGRRGQGAQRGRGEVARLHIGRGIQAEQYLAGSGQACSWVAQPDSPEQQTCGVRPGRSREDMSYARHKRALEKTWLTKETGTFWTSSLDPQRAVARAVARLEAGRTRRMCREVCKPEFGGAAAGVARFGVGGGRTRQVDAEQRGDVPGEEIMWGESRGHTTKPCRSRYPTPSRMSQRERERERVINGGA